MAYRIIKKNLQVVKILTEDESRVLECVPVANTAAAKKRTDFLSSLHNHKQWLSCSCNERSVIYVAHSTVPYMYTKSNSAHAEHEEYCDFSPKGEGRQGPQPKPLKDEDKYNLQPKPVIKKVGDDPEPAKTTGKKVVSRRHNKFYRLVRNMFLRAGLNVVRNGEEGTYKDQKTKLVSAAEELHLDPSIKVSQLLFINYANLDDVSKKIMAYQRRFTKNHPYGVCLWIASSYEKTGDGYKVDIGRERTILLGNAGTSISNFHSLDGGNNGPYLFAGLYTYLPISGEQEKGEFSLTQLLIIPLLSLSNWMFVDSHYEREIGLKLVNSASYWYEKESLVSVLEKPLEDIKVNEHYVLPDYDIMIGDFRQFIEVMGFDHPSYISRKKRQIQLMEKIAPVKKVNTVGLTGVRLSEKAFSFSKNLFIGFLKDKTGA